MEGDPAIVAYAFRIGSGFHLAGLRTDMKIPSTW